MIFSRRIGFRPVTVVGFELGRRGIVKLVIIGEALSQHLNYYAGYSTMTQNSCGDILFDCDDDKVHIYVEDSAHQVDFLDEEGNDHDCGLYYVGTPQCSS